MTAALETLDISAMSARTGVTVTALRWYEQAGLLLHPPGRTAGGRRRYTEQDVAWLGFLTRLRSSGMPVRDIRAYADLCRNGPGNEAERLALLEAHRDGVKARLAQARRDLTDIEAKLALYREKTQR